jgi:hypothetical protein
MVGGKTAVVTGASSGIGETFARRLAGDGFDLVLVARREERLEAMADEMRRKNGVRAEALVADLSVREEIHRVADGVRGIETLELLINNAGFGMPDDFHEADLQKNIEMINVHVLATTCLCHAALTGMVRRHRGSIINVSSVAAFLPMPHAATYCSTKAFIRLFSEALSMEVKDAGVRVQALCPGYTITGFHDTPLLKNFDRSAIPKGLWMSSEDVVTASLKALARDKCVCIPGSKNRVLVALLRNRITAAMIRVMSRGRYRDI